MKHRISMLWPDGLKKAVTFSYDDGVMQDLRLFRTDRFLPAEGPGDRPFPRAGGGHRLRIRGI